MTCVTSTSIRFQLFRARQGEGPSRSCRDDGGSAPRRVDPSATLSFPLPCPVTTGACRRPCPWPAGNAGIRPDRSARRDQASSRQSNSRGTWKLKPGFWIRRLLVVFLVASIVLFLVELLKGHERGAALQFALFWGAMTAGVFTLVGYIRFRRNPACMLPVTGRDGTREDRKSTRLNSSH